MTPGLSNYDYHRASGLLARFYAEDGRVRQRLFSHSRYGYDPARTREAACAWLRACLATTSPRSRVRPGAGVCRRWKRQRGRHPVLVYDVSYILGGKRYTRSFRVRPGQHEQLVAGKARAFRTQMEQAMDAEKHQRLARSWRG